MELSKQCKKDNWDTKTTEYDRAMATLVASGWDPMDAYMTTYGADASLSEDYHRERVKAITEKKFYKVFYEKIRAKMNPEPVIQIVHDSPKKKGRKRQESEGSDIGDIDFTRLSKEDVLREMQKTINALDVNNPKRVEMLARYADLEQMKKEESEEDKNLVHFYLPSKCSSCPLKIADDRKSR